MKQAPVKIVEARIDWITATAKEWVGAENLTDFGIWVCNREQVLGSKQATWGTHGASGYRCGACRWAVGPEWTIVQLGGELAQQHAATLATLAGHWSRCDYAVTVLHEDKEYDPSEEWWTSRTSEPGSAAGRIKLSRTQELKRGRTIYAGSRTSARYARCYNKYYESKGRYPPSTWRYEVELKREASEFEHSMWRASGRTGEDMADYVAATWRKAGVAVPFAHREVELPQLRVHRDHDADRLLAWFRRQVRPGVEFLVSLGREAESLDALGYKRTT